MASNEIIFKQELRPCLVYYNETQYKALFHKWNEINNKVIVGMVELEDGRMDEVPISKIKFIDNKMEEFDFGEEQKTDDFDIDCDDLPF